MSKEYTCDTCRRVFYDRDCIWPVDERRDYCSDECFRDAKQAGQITECPNGCGDVTDPHNCPWKNGRPTAQRGGAR